MKRYSGPEDIYKELAEDSDENWLYRLVAFAVVEEQRIEWTKPVIINLVVGFNKFSSRPLE